MLLTRIVALTYTGTHNRRKAKSGRDHQGLQNFQRRFDLGQLVPTPTCLHLPLHEHYIVRYR